MESQNIKNYVESLKPVPVLGHTMHSYSQLWLWPYGYAYNAYPENYREIVSLQFFCQIITQFLIYVFFINQKKLAEDAADALYQVHGTYFDPINSAELCKYEICHYNSSAPFRKCKNIHLIDNLLNTGWTLTNCI